MELIEQQLGAVVVLKPSGSLTEGDADLFRNKVLAAASRNLGRVVIDAEGITFVDSHGLEALAFITDQLGEGGRILKLCGTNVTLRRVLELTGWAHAFEFFDDTTSAVRSFL